jgi:hypothetical protein
MEPNKESPLNKLIGKRAIVIPLEDSFWPLSDQFVGLEMEIEQYNKTQLKEHQAKYGDTIWTPHNDGSLRGGIELVLTQPLMGRQLSDAINVWFDTFTKYAASPRTSIHVHLNMCQDNDTLEVLTNMIVLYYMYEDSFFHIADENRKWCSYCNPFEDNPPQILLDTLSIDAVKTLHGNLIESAGTNTNRYYGLNLNALQRFGTLEFRHLPLVYQRERLVDWISLIMELKLAARKLATEGLTPYTAFPEATDLAKLEQHYMPRFGRLLQSFVDHRTALQRMNNLAALLLPRVKSTYEMGKNKAWAKYIEASKDKIKPPVRKRNYKEEMPIPQTLAARPGRNLPPPRPVREVQWVAPTGTGWGDPQVFIDRNGDLQETHGVVQDAPLPPMGDFDRIPPAPRQQMNGAVMRAAARRHPDWQRQVQEVLDPLEQALGRGDITNADVDNTLRIHVEHIERQLGQEQIEQERERARVQNDEIVRQMREFNNQAAGINIALGVETLTGRLTQGNN